jgi:hypothetical protein
VRIERVARQVTTVELLAESEAEAKRYAERDVKGPRLARCEPWQTEAVLSATARDAEAA